MARAPKQTQPACIDGLPHHWMIASDRCEAGFYPGTCRNCGRGREFWGDGPDDRHYYGVYQTPVNQVATFRVQGPQLARDSDRQGLPELDD